MKPLAKITPLLKCDAPHCKIHPVLYRFFLRLRERLGAKMVHRRKRDTSMSIEITFSCKLFDTPPVGRLNTLPEAEECGFWIMCRPQTSRKRMFYRGRRVYQLFLTPVHPKKRRATDTLITSLHATQPALPQAAVG
ncbi:MAG: hypothetical protein IK073_01995 [Paludibacteraceae bacterium]|nr:hypothetical protein [Paludibacteraceae bacterium]